MLERLVRSLRLNDLDPTAEEIADALWFASYVAPLPQSKQSAKDKHEKAVREPGILDEFTSGEKPPGSETLKDPEDEASTDPVNQSQTAEGQKIYADSLGIQAAGYGIPAVRTQSPAAPTSPAVLAISRALRPLKRRIASKSRQVLDEVTTVHRTAEATWSIQDGRPIVPLLSFRPQQERWLDLALVIDAAAGLRIWDYLLDKVHRQLLTLGAFRQVTVWGLETDSPTGPVLLSSRGGSKRDAKELLSTDGRRLVLIATDLVAPAWRSTKMKETLDEWGRKQPLALLQLLSRDLWPKTALSQVQLALATAPSPGAPNPQLRLRTDPTVNQRQLPGWPPIPILEFDAQSPKALALWAQHVAGSGTASIEVALWDTARMKPLPATKRTRNPKGDAAEAVAALRSRVSRSAQRLASLFAIVMPSTLPVLRLIQWLFMETAKPSHLAEVILSGIVRAIGPIPREADAELVNWDMDASVKEVLLRELDFGTRQQVERVVSKFLADRSGSRDVFSTWTESEEGTTQITPSTQAIGQIPREKTIPTESLSGSNEPEAATVQSDSPQSNQGVLSPASAPAQEVPLQQKEPKTEDRGPLPMSAIPDASRHHYRHFVGREDEIIRFRHILAAGSGRAVVIVGQQGMGKTTLAERLLEDASQHPMLDCRSIWYEVTRLETVDALIERMLEGAFAAAGVQGSFSPSEQRRMQWEALLQSVPKYEEIQGLLYALKQQPTLPPWERFARVLHEISARLEEHQRVLFVVDPEKYMKEGSAEAWRILVRRLPDKVVLVLPQRPEDELARDAELLREPNVTQLPEGRFLATLEADAVEALVQLNLPRLRYSQEDVLDALGRYRGHPSAVTAALDLLDEDRLALKDLPLDPAGIATEQWQRVCQQSDEWIRIFKAYAVLGVPVLAEVVQSVAEVDPEALQRLKAHAYVGGLLRPDYGGTRIYHSLLSDHILSMLSAAEATAYYKRGQDVLQQRLHLRSAAQRLDDDDARVRAAAVRYFAESGPNDPETRSAIAYRLEDEDAAVRIAAVSFFAENGVNDPETRYAVAQRLDDQSASVRTAAVSFFAQVGADDPDTRAAVAQCLDDQSTSVRTAAVSFFAQVGADDPDTRAAVAQRLDDEDASVRTAAARFFTQVGADAPETRSAIAQRLDDTAAGAHKEARRLVGDLDGAEKTHQKALEIDKQLGNREGMASHYSNLGLIYRTRGDLDEAEKMYKQALEINKQLGSRESMAGQYGNLGLIYETRGDLDAAERMYKQALKINKQLGNREGVAGQYGNLGLIYETRGDLDATKQMYQQALEIWTKLEAALAVDDLPPDLPQAWNHISPEFQNRVLECAKSGDEEAWRKLRADLLFQPKPAEFSRPAWSQAMDQIRKAFEAAKGLERLVDRVEPGTETVQYNESLEPRGRELQRIDIQKRLQRLNVQETLHRINRVEKAIEDALEQGQHGRAKAFADVLIHSQTESFAGEHLAKTLCRIAATAVEHSLFEWAQELYQKAEIENPLDPIPQLGKAECQRMQGYLQEAEETYRNTTQRWPESVIAHNGLAETLRAKGQLDEAEDIYRHTVKRWPNDVVAQNGLAETLRAKGQLDEAEDIYRHTVKRWPEDILAHFGLAETLRARGKRDEAEDIYRNTTQRWPESVVAHVGLAETLRAKGKRAEAEEIYRNTVQRWPNDVVAHNGLAELLRARGKRDEAEEIYRNTVKRWPEDILAHFGLAETLRAKGQLDQAEEIYRNTVKRWPNAVVAQSGLAETLRAKGELDEAEEIYRNTVQRWSEDVVVHNGLAETLRAKGELDEAEEIYRHTVKRWPENAVAYNGLAETLRAKENSTKPKKSLRGLPTERIRGQEAPRNSESDFDLDS